MGVTGSYTEDEPAKTVESYFLGDFPLVSLWKISENVRFSCTCQIGQNSALQGLVESQFAAKYSSMFGKVHYFQQVSVIPQ